jgi:hypothetical protein
VLSPDQIDVYVREYERPGGVQGSCSDYRTWPEDVAQDIVDKNLLISCPVLSLRGADFKSIGQAFDMKTVWDSMASYLSTLAIDRCGHPCQEERHDWTGMGHLPAD